MAEAGGDVIGLDWRVPLDDGWELVGHDRGVQGNLDPARPARARSSASQAEAERILERAGGRPGHIFNLGHGVLPDTDPAALGRLVELVHERTAHRRGVNTAVVLMAYGCAVARSRTSPPTSPTSARASPVSERAVEELAERYRRIGGRSPLDEVTEAQRAALERELGLPVTSG